MDETGDIMWFIFITSWIITLLFLAAASGVLIPIIIACIIVYVLIKLIDWKINRRR